MIERINTQLLLRGAVIVVLITLGITGYWQYKNASSKPIAAAKANEASGSQTGAKSADEKPASSSRLLQSFGNSSTTEQASQKSVAKTNAGKTSTGSAWGSNGRTTGGDALAKKTRPFYESPENKPSGESEENTDGGEWGGAGASASSAEEPTVLTEQTEEGGNTGGAKAAGSASEEYLEVSRDAVDNARKAFLDAEKYDAQRDSSAKNDVKQHGADATDADNPLRKSQSRTSTSALSAAQRSALSQNRTDDIGAGAARAGPGNDKFDQGNGAGQYENSAQEAPSRNSGASRYSFGAGASSSQAENPRRFSDPGTAAPKTATDAAGYKGNERSQFDPFSNGAPGRHDIAGAAPLRQALGAASQRSFAAGPEGAGEPGNRQLEGPQTPAISIVKVAPPEIQIGKPAVFEIRVRNASQIPATNLQIHDTVPRGTQFIGSSPATEPGPRGDLLWTVGELRPGDEQIIKLELMPVAEGEIGSVARVSFTAEASVRTIATRPELKLEVTGPREILIGQDVPLRIKVWNPGTGPATGIVLSEEIPKGLLHSQGPILEYEVGDLRPNQSKELELTLQAEKAGMVTNILQARGDGSLSAEVQTQIQVVAPGLEVAIHGPQKRYLERPANYTVSVANPGTAPAKDIELVTYLPKGMKFVKADGFGQYDPRSNAVYWSLEELPPNQRGNVILSLLPSEQGAHTLAVEGTAKMNLFHRQEHEVTVEGVAAMLFEVKDLADPIDIGGETTYEIKVENQGSKAATDVQVVVEFPPELKPVGADGPSQFSIRGNQIIFAGLSRLAPRAEVVYEVRAQGIRPGDARLRVRLTSAELTAPVTNEESTRVFADE